jgi:2-polyprenyl-6-methoxyphenol hydroxylase-like FAD-dependent oxidoreductase
MHVLIIGAGTGGLALAHGLKRSRIEVSIFERYRGPNEDQGGYRVGISPAGSRALKACVPASLYELFVGTCARAPRYFNMLTEQFAELLCLDLQRDGVDMADGERNVIRSTLRQVLLTGLEDSVHFGKRFVRYEERTDGTVTAFFDDPSMAQCISIRTSVPPEPWESSNVTLLGDAVHTMTPGRGAGANTALRDAELLSGLLREVHRGTTPLFEGIHAYESEMLRYSSEAVFESRKQMDSNDSIHKPVIGRMQLAAMRAGMRLVNSAPMLKRRVIRNIMRVRGSN